MNDYPYGFNPASLFNTPDEGLTKLVQGKKASDLEERTARAINKQRDWSYIFRQRLAPAELGGYLEQTFSNIAGETEIDFLAFRGNYVIPILVDGQIGHYMSDWQKIHDDAKTARIDQLAARYGWQPARRIKYDKLLNQDMADMEIREILK